MPVSMTRLEDARDSSSRGTIAQPKRLFAVALSWASRLHQSCLDCASRIDDKQAPNESITMLFARVRSHVSSATSTRLEQAKELATQTQQGSMASQPASPSAVY